MRVTPILLPLFLGLAAMGSAVAADRDEMDRLLAADLDVLMSLPVSIATSSPQALSKTPAVVSVITAEDIRATGAANLVDLLQSVPGIYIRTNQFGFRPLVSVRGASPKNTLIMVNGAPQRDLVWATGIFWKGLPVSMIERIEVIRGPGSALYGSDASAGVINIITRTAGRIDTAEAGVRIGSFDTQTAWLAAGREIHGFDVGFTMEAAATDGHRPFIARDFGGTADQANYGYDNVDLRFSIARDHWRVLADHMQKDAFHIGLNGGSYLDPLTRAKDRQSSVAWLYKNPDFAQDWGLEAEVRYRDLDYSSGNGFWEVPATTLSKLRSGEQRFNAEISAAYRGFRDHELRVGGGYVWQDLYHVSRTDNGVPNFFAPEQSRRNTYVFIQDLWHFAERWELTAGARYDRYSDFGGTLNPRLALVWETTERLTTKLLYGRAFRAPSFLELYAQTGANNPNPNLKPEESTTRELSFSYRATRDLNLSANLFDYLQANPIVDSAGTFRNVDEHRIRGVELEALWQATNTLRLAANATYRKPDDEQFKRLRVPDHFAIPRQDAYLRADWAFLPKWHWNLQANWTGKRSQSATDPRQPLGAQTLVDTTVRYYHGSEWEFAAGVRNLFDEDARDYSGTRIPQYLPLPGRNAFFEARYKF